MTTDLKNQWIIPTGLGPEEFKPLRAPTYSTEVQLMPDPSTYLKSPETRLQEVQHRFRGANLSIENITYLICSILDVYRPAPDPLTQEGLLLLANELQRLRTENQQLKDQLNEQQRDPAGPSTG